MYVKPLKKDIKISESPHAWVIIKMTTNGDDLDNTYYKVFASWAGGYLDGDRWKMNSGISRIDEDEEYYYFYGMSGSCYACHKEAYGIRTSYSQGILDNVLSNAYKVNIKAEVLPKETNWINILNLK